MIDTYTHRWLTFLRILSPPRFSYPFFSFLFFLHRRVLFLDVSRLGNFFFVSVRKDGMRRVSRRKLGLYKFRSFFPVACLLLFFSFSLFTSSVYRRYIYIYSKYQLRFRRIHLQNIKFLFKICKKILKENNNYFNL